MDRYIRALFITYNKSSEQRFVSSFVLESSDNCADVELCFKNRLHKLRYHFDFYEDLCNNTSSDLLNVSSLNKNITSIDNCYEEAFNYHEQNKHFFNLNFAKEYQLVKEIFKSVKNGKNFYFSKRKKLKISSIETDINTNNNLFEDICTIISNLKDSGSKKNKNKRKYEINIQKLIVKLKTDHSITNKEISKLLDVSNNQIKNAINSNKDGRLRDILIDNRGIYKKMTSKRTQYIYYD